MKKETSRWSEADYEAYLRRKAGKGNEGETQQVPTPPAARSFNVKLPIPPPVTQVYANSKVGGRVLTPIAKQWKFNAGCLIKLAAQRQQWWYYPGARLYMSIIWHFAGESSDIDNPIKILQDTLATTLLFNDKVIDAEDILRGEDCPDEPNAEVELGFKDESYQTRRELIVERDQLLKLVEEKE
jgi:Holliday junction resolvase RusA-like endonuclease